jgi:hypothetical protein
MSKFILTVSVFLGSLAGFSSIAIGSDGKVVSDPSGMSAVSNEYAAAVEREYWVYYKQKATDRLWSVAKVDQHGRMMRDETVASNYALYLESGSDGPHVEITRVVRVQ